MQKRYRVKGIHHSNAMTKKMLQVYPKIAWDTEIWIAEEATHLTHKNGGELPLPCGTVVPMEEASDSRNNYSSLTRRFWLFVPIRAYSLMPLSL